LVSSTRGKNFFSWVTAGLSNLERAAG
jgi:hypothetical protein